MPERNDLCAALVPFVEFPVAARNELLKVSNAGRNFVMLSGLDERHSVTNFDCWHIGRKQAPRSTATHTDLLSTPIRQQENGYEATVSGNALPKVIGEIPEFFAGLTERIIVTVTGVGSPTHPRRYGSETTRPTQACDMPLIAGTRASATSTSALAHSFSADRWE